MRSCWIALVVAVAPLALGRGDDDATTRAEAGAPRREPELRAALADYLAQLRPESRAQAQFAFADPQRLDWHFIPRERRGLPLAAMALPERLATDALLRQFLNTRGYLRVQGVLELEEELREAEQAAGRDGLWRDRERYFVSLFGDLAASEPWGMRFEGHHLSLQFTGVPGSGVAVTPLFLGANPAQVRRGGRAGLTLLGSIETAARALLHALTPEQRASAVIAATAPADVLFGPGQAPPDRTAGVALDRLGDVATARLIELILELPFADLGVAQPEPLDDALDQGGPADGRFVWAGGGEVGAPHYWRLWLGSQVVEWDDTQDGANHVHLLVRDVRHDFASGWLADHRRQERPAGASPGQAAGHEHDESSR
ncbi:MAG: DUF3500 domain-containing protein [Planctomycetes bacterium]|nr:DUF3500 domain-containing protein [Planctomycetota bacterium]